VYIHGGGFVGGDKDNARRSHNVQKSLDRGVAFAAIHYRLIHPQGSDMSDPQRTGLQNVLRDSARAVQYLRHHAAKYNLDPARVACYGGSAGAGTSIWLAFHDDLADPDNADPVLRESTRISAAGMLAGQFSYDLTQWDAEFVKQGGDLAKVYGSTTPQYHRLFAMTPDDYEASDVRHDVDMRGLITSGDAPVFALTNNPDEPVVDVGIYNHHPLHAQLIEVRCQQHGVEVQCLVPKVRQQDAKYLKEHPDALLEFLFRHLGVSQT